MKKVLIILFLIPFSLFGKGSAPPNTEKTQDFIVSNCDAEDAGAWSDNGRILSDDEGIVEVASFIPPPSHPKVSIDLKQVFKGSPIIYSILLFLSMTAVFLWLYTILRWRVLSRYNDALRSRLYNLLNSNKRNEAIILCRNRSDLLSRMVLASLSTNKVSCKDLEEIMSNVVRRASEASWQRISILNDIAILSPMLGLMGTVLGMFYAFYDLNRSLNSLNKLFDGLGISVGTTVAGMCVALIALLLHIFLKHRLIRRLSLIAHEAEALIPLLVEKEKK